MMRYLNEELCSNICVIFLAYKQDALSTHLVSSAKKIKSWLWEPLRQVRPRPNQHSDFTYRIVGINDKAFNLMIWQNLCDSSIFKFVINTYIQYR